MGWLTRLATDRIRKKQKQEELPEEAHVALVEMAGILIRARVMVTLEDWRAMEVPEQEAWLLAAKRLDVEAAVRTGRSTTELGSLRVMAEIDGGEEHDRKLLQQAMESLRPMLDSGIAYMGGA